MYAIRYKELVKKDEGINNNMATRIEPDVKEQAEGILAALGIPASNAINMFYKQIILQRGLPFEVKMPSARPVGISALSEAQMNAELEKGLVLYIPDDDTQVVTIIRVMYGGRDVDTQLKRLKKTK